MHAVILLVIAVLVAGEDLLSCEDYCSSLLPETPRRPDCVCYYKLKDPGVNLDKIAQIRDDSNIYYEPSESYANDISFTKKQFHIENPIYKKSNDEPKSKKIMTKNKNNKSVRSSEGKYHDSNIYKINIQERENNKPLYLDIDINKKYNIDRSAEDSGIHNMNLTEYDLIECIDLHILVFSRNNDVDKQLKDIWDDKKNKKYEHLSNSDLMIEIQNKCHHPSRILKDSLQEITRSNPKKPSFRSSQRKNKENSSDNMKTNVLGSAENVIEAELSKLLVTTEPNLNVTHKEESYINNKDRSNYNNTNNPEDTNNLRNKNNSSNDLSTPTLNEDTDNILLSSQIPFDSKNDNNFHEAVTQQTHAFQKKMIDYQFITQKPSQSSLNDFSNDTALQPLLKNIEDPTTEGLLTNVTDYQLTVKDLNDSQVKILNEDEVDKNYSHTQTSEVFPTKNSDVNSLNGEQLINYATDIDPPIITTPFYWTTGPTLGKSANEDTTHIDSIIKQTFDNYTSDAKYHPISIDSKEFNVVNVSSVAPEYNLSEKIPDVNVSDTNTQFDLPTASYEPTNIVRHEVTHNLNKYVTMPPLIYYTDSNYISSKTVTNIIKNVNFADEDSREVNDDDNNILTTQHKNIHPEEDIVKTFEHTTITTQANQESKINQFVTDAIERLGQPSHRTETTPTESQSSNFRPSIYNDSKLTENFITESVTISSPFTNEQTLSALPSENRHHVHYSDQEIQIPRILTKELYNDSVVSTVNGTESNLIDDFRENAVYSHTLSNEFDLGEQTMDSSSVSPGKLFEHIPDSNSNLESGKFASVRQPYVTGKLYFLFGDKQVPARFVQDPDGQIDLGLDGPKLCDMKQTNESLIMAALCKCLQSEKCLKSDN